MNNHNMTNFPAAHSMDTTWFAVDSEGRVARFESGEAGAVPNTAASGGGAAEPSFDVLLLDVACVLDRLLAEPPRKRTFDRAGRAVIVVEPVAQDGVLDYRTPATKSAIEVTKDLIAVSSRVFVTKTDHSLRDLAKLAEHPDVRFLATEHEIYDWLGDETPGLFHFEHDHDRYEEPGAYHRESSPKRALRVEDIPEPIRKDVEAVRLPVKFDEIDSLHLADHMKDADAAIWGEATLRGEPLPQKTPAAKPQDRSSASRCS